MKQFETVKCIHLTKKPVDIQQVIFLIWGKVGTPSFTLNFIQLFVLQIVGFFFFGDETVTETVTVFLSLFGAVILDFNLIANDTIMKHPYTNAILNDFKGDLKARWSISFWVWSVDEQKKIRKFDYSLNKYSTVRERRLYAKKRIEAINSLLEKGYHIDKAKNSPVVVATIESALKHALSVCSISHASKLSYNSTVKLFLAWCEKRNQLNNPIELFNKKDVFEYRDKLKADGKAGVTINSDVACLKRMWNILKKREMVKENPWNILEKEKEIITNRNIAYTWGEVGKLSELISKSDKELWCFISMIYHTLARPNELRQLQVYNIHLNKRKIYFDALKTKNKNERWINLHDGLIETIIELIKNKSSNEYLFPGSNAGKPVSKNRMTARHREFLKKLGWDDGDHTLYSWKHTGVIMAYEAGVDIKSIQQQCGHSSIMETDNYLKTLGLYNNHEIILKQPILP
jgi:integrase